MASRNLLSRYVPLFLMLSLVYGQERELLSFDYDIDSSLECLVDCIDEMNVFCLEWSWVNPAGRGVCCQLGDDISLLFTILGDISS